MDEPVKLWRAELGTNVSADRGHSILAWYGHLTPCGEWVEQGQARWRRDDSWFTTEAEAKASLADRIEAIALACNRQARQLRLVAQEAEAT